MDIFANYRESSKIDMTLKAINLGHLVSNFSKKYVTHDTFFNLTAEDLDYLDITNEEERNKILTEIKPYQSMYKKFYDPITLEKSVIIKQTNKQLQLICSVVSYLQQSLKICQSENPLIDDATSTATCLKLLSTSCIQQVRYIENDLLAITKTENKKPTTLRWLLIFLTIPAFGCAAILYPKITNCLHPGVLKKLIPSSVASKYLG